MTHNIKNLPVPGIPVKKSQTQRFSESLTSIFFQRNAYTNPVILFAENLVQSATIVVFSPLSGGQLRSLCNLADSWNHEIMIGRGPLGAIQIEFNLKSK